MGLSVHDEYISGVDKNRGIRVWQRPRLGLRKIDVVCNLLNLKVARRCYGNQLLRPRGTVPRAFQNSSTQNASEQTRHEITTRNKDLRVIMHGSFLLFPHYVITDSEDQLPL